MIKNEKQHKMAKSKLNKWLKTQTQLQSTAVRKNDWLAKEQAFGVEQQIKQLRAEIIEYEETVAGNRKLLKLELVSEIPSMLIRWRIARHLTQRQLTSVLVYTKISCKNMRLKTTVVLRTRQSRT